MACCVHPEKSCIALQVSEATLILLFLKERSAEEVKLVFQKAKQIYAFSFTFGDDFNCFVATNFSIDIYKIKLGKQKHFLEHLKLKNQTSNDFNDGYFSFQPSYEREKNPMIPETGVHQVCQKPTSTIEDPNTATEPPVDNSEDVSFREEDEANEKSKENYKDISFNDTQRKWTPVVVPSSSHGSRQFISMVDMFSQVYL